jgi:transcriptional regulator with XRE-family HTH domain
MDWKRIRDHYATLFDESNLTQAVVAERGQLSGQNAVSKLLDNNVRGPSVETFVRAVAGLGLSLSEFFTGLETASSSVDSPSVGTRVRPASASESSSSSPPCAPRRAHDVSSAFIHPGNVVNITRGDESAREVARFAHMVDQHFTDLKVQLERVTDRLAAHGPADRDAHPQKTRVRARARRRVRKTA